MNTSDPQSNSSDQEPSYTLDWILAILAAITCILIVASFAYLNSPDLKLELSVQWPFPLIYFIEITIIGILCVVALGYLHRSEIPTWSVVFWVSSGILLSFVILGAWTIGFYLIPAMVIYLILGIRNDRRFENDIPRHVIHFVSAGIAQSLFVLLTLTI